MRIFLLSLTLFAMLGSSCQKKVPSFVEQYPQISGSYDWVYSIGANQLAITHNTSEIRYGIEIGKKDRVRIYHNGTFHEKGKIKSVYESSGVLTVSIELESESIYLKVGVDVISDSFPFSDMQNYLQQK